MRLAGKFEGVTGIVFGEMLDCTSAGAPADLTERVILKVMDWFPGPIAFGLRSGHVSRSNVTLPMGVEAELVVEAQNTELRVGARAGVVKRSDEEER
jgi:muramoyltetrapeptide carboxypeptidase